MNALHENVRYVQGPFTSPCWVWTGDENRNGYGIIRYWDKERRGSSEMVHKISYRKARGPIREGFTVDHLCRNRLCFNPDHLEAVTGRVNTLRSENPCAKNARKTHCIRGHELPSVRNYHGKRQCNECRKIKLTGVRQQGIKLDNMVSAAHAARF